MSPFPAEAIRQAAEAMETAAAALASIKPGEREQMDDEDRADIARIERWLRVPPVDLERLAHHVAAVQPAAPIYGARL
jgi:hypothetical protein